MIKNKKGWIRVVEAFVAILLVAGIVLIVVGQKQAEKGDISSRVYSSQISILREIQINNSLREEIINIPDLSLPVEWEEFDASAPKTKAKINESSPGYLECVGKICSADDVCLLADAPDKTIYAESVIISSNLQTYSPKFLKLFCWEK